VKRKNIFIIILVSVALTAGIILLVGSIQKRSGEESRVENDSVERVVNILNNSFFEQSSGEEANWEISDKNSRIISGYDNIVKYEGDFSFNITNESEQGEFYISQKVKNINRDRKLALFGFIKSEDIDSAKFEIGFYFGDSLLIKGYSETITGTTDWTEYNAWIKTFLSSHIKPDSLSVQVKGILFGKGRIWFDNIRLYSIPIKETIYDIQSYTDS
jgi:hypothetical protein